MFSMEHISKLGEAIVNTISASQSGAVSYTHL